MYKTDKLKMRKHHRDNLKAQTKEEIQFRRFNIVKIPIFPSDITPFKITAGFFVEIDKLIVIFTWKCKEPRMA